MEYTPVVHQYRDWILQHNIKGGKFEVSDEEIKIETTNGYGKVVFNELDIIELLVYNEHTQDFEFYLHFQVTTLQHAKELFNEMLDALNHLINKPVYKILLCCSGGLTTSYFAQMINEVVKDLYNEYKISATSYMKLYDIGDQYDLIMLAPQISYILPKVQEVYKDKRVINIPPQVFAKYDIGAMLTIINREIDFIKKQKQTLKSRKPLLINKEIPKHNKILVLSIIRNSKRIHVMYRIYNEENNIIIDQEVIKYKLSIKDIYDVIDTILLIHPDIKNIGLSIPGIINRDILKTSNINGFEEVDILGSLKNRYKDCKVCIENDVNTAAVGYYVSLEEKCDITALFQPVNAFSGAGTVIDGNLFTGKNHLAGEMQFLPLALSDDIQVLNKTPEGMLELVSKLITCIISVIEPDMIVLFCTLITQEDELVEQIKKLIPNQPLPDIVIDDSLHQYTLLGQMIICASEEL